MDAMPIDLKVDLRHWRVGFVIDGPRGKKTCWRPIPTKRDDLRSGEAVWVLDYDESLAVEIGTDAWAAIDEVIDNDPLIRSLIEAASREAA